MLKQVLRNRAKLVRVLAEKLFAGLGSRVEDVLDLLVNHRGSLLGIALGLTEVATDEDAVAGGVVGNGAEPVTHAVFHHHVAGDGACLLDIAGRAGGDVVKEQLFRYSAAERHDDVFKHFALRLEVFKILLRSEQGKAASHASGDDGYIVDGVNMGEVVPRDGMTRLVISGELSRLLAHLAALLLGTHLNLEYGLVDVRHVDKAVLSANGQQCRLVHQVFKVGAGKARSALCDGVEVNVLGKLLVAGMNFEYGLAPLDIGQADIDLSVKAAGTQKRVIEDIRAVRRRHDDNALVAAEAVHLDKELVEGLFALIMSAAEAAASLTADGVDLVDEYDCGRCLLGLLKQVAHTPRADAYIKLNKVGAGDGEELDPRLARHGLGKQCLTGARRADKQNALRHARAHRGVCLGIFKEVNDLAELFLFLVAACDIRKGLFILLVAAESGACLGELADGAGTASAAVHHHVPEEHPAAHDEQVRQKACPPGYDKALVIIVLLDYAGLVLLADNVLEVLVKDGEVIEVIGHLLCGLRGVVGTHFKHDKLGTLGSERLDLLTFKKVYQLRVIFDFFGLCLLPHCKHNGNHNNNKQNVKAKVADSFGIRFQASVTSFGFGEKYL